MADNSARTPGSGENIRTVEKTSVKAQVVVIDSGGSGAEDIAAGVLIRALPSGTNTIGKLGANSGVDIGDVDVASIIPGTAATNLGKAEDAAHASGDTGVMALAVRNDGGSPLAGADGDYIPITTDGAGRVRVTAGEVIPGTAAADLGKAEDAAHSDGDTGVMSLAVRKDTAAALAGTDGDYAPLEVDASGRLHVAVGVLPALVAGTATIGKLGANSGVDIGDTDVTSVTPGTGATALGKAEDAAHASGDTGVMALAVRKDTAAATADTDGDYEPLIVDSSGRLHVNVGTSALPTGAATSAKQDTAAALLTTIDADTSNLNDAIKVDDAAFTPGTTKVVMLGAQADDTSPDSVDEGDAGALRMTLDRLLKVTAFMESGAIYANGVALTPKFAAVAAASSGDNTLVAAVTGKKIRVLALMLVAAGTVSTYVTSAAAGTVIFGGSTNKIALVANTGFVLPFSPVGWFENSSANQALILNLSGAIAVSGGLVYVEV